MKANKKQLKRVKVCAGGVNSEPYVRGWEKRLPGETLRSKRLR